MFDEIILDLKTHVVNKKKFKHESASVVATKDMMMKNSSETVVQQEYIRRQPDNKGNIFKINTLSEKISDGSATKKISADMNSLINEISVGVDEQGNIKNIYNIYDIEEKWEVLKKRWKKEATKEDKEQILKTITIIDSNIANGSFIKEIAQQGVLHFLLHGLYNNYTKDVVVQKDIVKFLVTQSLPLNITYKVKEFNRETRKVLIEGVGELAEDRLDKKTLTKLIRGIKDKVNLKVELQVDYRETFEFDEYHWLVKAKQQVKVKIPGFYMAETKQEITEIDKL